MLQSIADRGRALIQRREPARERSAGLIELCEALLSGRGEASGVALASDSLASVRMFESREDRQMALKFEEKPSQAVIDKLKDAGYRWNPAEKIWAYPVRSDGAMATRIEASRLLIYSTAAKKDRRERCDVETGLAKLFATETAAEVSLEAMRILGGNGFSKDFPVERFYREYVGLGRLVGVRDGDLPAGWTGFRDYFDRVVSHDLRHTESVDRVSPSGHATLRFLA